MAVPRFIWNILLTAIALGLAWGGRNSLETILTNFLSLLGYWTICFGGILAIENFYFRPRIGGYDLEGWQDQKRMPYGIAGCTSLALGIGVSFLGMDQTWVSYTLILFSLITLFSTNELTHTSLLAPLLS
jgi:purine-cytosine permease-like protein